MWCSAFLLLMVYLAQTAYVGATVGRTAGRIRNAAFLLEGRDVSLTANERPHHLHGGVRGFDKQLWHATPSLSTDRDASLTLRYRSPDGEEGYPGNLDVAITYTVGSSNDLLIETVASTDRDTPFSPTHHSYFNLDGEGAGDTSGQTVQIFAEGLIPLDDELLPLDRFETIEGSAAEANPPRVVSDLISSIAHGHGDLYGLRTKSHSHHSEDPQLAARHWNSSRDLQMSVYTTEPCMQLYTASAFDGSLVGKSGKAYARHAGLCFECQGYPTGVCHPMLGSNVLRSGVIHRRQTRYAFTEGGPPDG